MKRPILTATIGFLIGILGGLYLNMVLFIFLFNLTILIARYIQDKKIIRIIKLWLNKSVIILLIVTAVFGYWYIYYIENTYKKIYILSGKVEIEGIVVSEPIINEYNKTYELKVHKINNKKISPKKFSFIVDKKQKDLEYGACIYCTGEYIKPNSRRNFKGFSYENYLKTKKNYGTIRAIEKSKTKYKNRISIVRRLSYRLKMKIINSTGTIFTKEDEEGVVLGIILGNTENITDETKDVFSGSSLSHLLAVSGAHISYIVLGLTTFFRKLRITKKINYILTAILLIFYLFVIGFTASATRAVIMTIFLLLQIVFCRKQDLATTISFSLCIILLENPYKILDVGLLLSYLGTLGIIIIFNKIKSKDKKMMDKLKDMCILTISAQVLILPVMAICFNTISFTFIISNLIASIIIGPIIIFGFILILISFFNMHISKIFAKPYIVLLKVLINVANYSSMIPISRIYVRTPYIISIILYYLFIAILIIIFEIQKSNRKFIKEKFQSILTCIKYKILKNKKSLCVCIALIILISIFINQIPSGLKIYFIDVGQGDSTLIVTPLNKTILIDGGGNENSNVGKNILLPYLLDRRIRKLDYVFISHFDTDHVRWNIIFNETYKNQAYYYY